MSCCPIIPSPLPSEHHCVSTTSQNGLVHRYQQLCYLRTNEVRKGQVVVLCIYFVKEGPDATYSINRRSCSTMQYCLIFSKLVGLDPSVACGSFVISPSYFGLCKWYKCAFQLYLGKGDMVLPTLPTQCPVIPSNIAPFVKTRSEPKCSLYGSSVVPPS